MRSFFARARPVTVYISRHVSLQHQQNTVMIFIKDEMKKNQKKNRKQLCFNLIRKGGMGDPPTRYSWVVLAGIPTTGQSCREMLWGITSVFLINLFQVNVMKETMSRVSKAEWMEHLQTQHSNRPLAVLSVSTHKRSCGKQDPPSPVRGMAAASTLRSVRGGHLRNST